MVSHYFVFRGQDFGHFAEVLSISAVEVFFVLSGFVLGTQIIMCGERGDWSTLRTFLIRRWMRTIPPYLIALAAMTVIAKTGSWADLVRYATYTQNLFFQANHSDYFPVAWSLAVEEWYYVTFPLVVLVTVALAKSTELRWFAIAAALFIVAVTAARLVLGDHSEQWGEAVRRIVAYRIDSIAYGFLLFLAVRGRIIRFDNPALLAVITLVSAAILISVNFVIIGGPPLLRMVQPMLSAVFGVSAVAFFLSLNTLRVLHSASSVMLFAGRVSYPIYLIHLPILAVLKSLDLSIGIFLYSAVVIVLASLFNYGFEQPLLAARPSFKNARGSDSVINMVPAK